jgi:hypothetical protein
VSPTIISLIFSKKCSKVISQSGNLFLFVIHPCNKNKVVATSVTSTQSLSLQHKKVDVIVEEYKDILSSPTGVSMHYQVKHPIDLTPDAPLPNGLVYRHSLMENDEIKCHIQDFLQKGHI